MRKKLWAAVLALAVLLGLTTASALADVMENIQVSDIQYYYPSGCLKGFTMTYTVGPGLEAADVRVSVQTEKFREHVSGYQYGDFRDNGWYAQKYHYKTWPDVPADCGFIAWNGKTFHRPASGERTTPLHITFADEQIDCNAGQKYYLYVWANYKGKTYPDAYVMQFTTGGGSIAVSTAKPGTAATATPKVTPTAAPTQAPTAAPTQAPTAAPTAAPTQAPTAAPTAAPTQAPTAAPTQAPTATPVVKPANMPKTGDHSSLALWVTLGLLSGCSMLALARKGRKDR